MRRRHIRPQDVDVTNPEEDRFRTLDHASRPNVHRANAGARGGLRIERPAVQGDGASVLIDAIEMHPHGLVTRGSRRHRDVNDGRAKLQSIGTEIPDAGNPRNYPTLVIDPDPNRERTRFAVDEQRAACDTRNLQLDAPEFRNAHVRDTVDVGDQRRVCREQIEARARVDRGWQ